MLKSTNISVYPPDLHIRYLSPSLIQTQSYVGNRFQIAEGLYSRFQNRTPHNQIFVRGIFIFVWRYAEVTFFFNCMHGIVDYAPIICTHQSNLLTLFVFL